MRITIDPSVAAPIYEQIREGIAQQILSGALSAGDPLPSIRVLARDLRVSVITTTRAYNELVADGLVDPVRGKGVFVRQQDAGEMRARALARIRSSLEDAVRGARVADIGADEVRALLDEVWEEER